MNFAINKTVEDAGLMRYATQIAGAFSQNGHQRVGTDQDLQFVLNLTDLANPKHYRRKSYDEFVVSLINLENREGDIKTACFSTLIRTLSNLVLGIDPNGDPSSPDLYYITPEAGFVKLKFNPQRVYLCMLPIVGSHFVLKKKITVDLPLSTELKCPELDELTEHAHQLGELGHLPSPFPLEDYLDDKMIRQLYRLYEMKGLSYGNLSVRNTGLPKDRASFWMTARGADKAHLQQVGRDILLVTGYDETGQQMNVSVPPDYDPRVRVSVDAIEHYLIYTAFPEVGAIVHIHAWIEGISSTTQNFPCGTYELADSVVELLRQSAKPKQTEIGLKNHGITITGVNLEEIFDRIKNRVQTRVPMFE